MRGILPLVFALATGCATPEYRAPAVSQPKSRSETVREVLGNARPVHLQNGYVTDVFTQPSLTTVAGIYAGTVTVRRTSSGVVAQGSYSQFQHPEAMNRACREADTNDDRIITPQEGRQLERRVLR